MFGFIFKLLCDVQEVVAENGPKVRWCLSLSTGKPARISSGLHWRVGISKGITVRSKLASLYKEKLSVLLKNSKFEEQPSTPMGSIAKCFWFEYILVELICQLQKLLGKKL